MKSNKNLLSIIYPVHNEAQNINKLLNETISVLEAAEINFEIIAVENASTDNTLEILNKLVKKDDRLSVINSAIGWGNAVKAGIKAASGELICYMVSDLQIDPKYIVELYELHKLYQKPYINRPYQLYKVWRTNRENRTRTINSRIYNLLARFIFQIDSDDINATPKLMESKLLKSLPLESPNISIDLEILLMLKRRGGFWMEVPAPSRKRDRGNSTTKLKTVLEMLYWMKKFASWKSV